MSLKDFEKHIKEKHTADNLLVPEELSWDNFVKDTGFLDEKRKKRGAFWLMPLGIGAIIAMGIFITIFSLINQSETVKTHSKSSVEIEITSKNFKEKEKDAIREANKLEGEIEKSKIEKSKITDNNQNNKSISKKQTSKGNNIHLNSSNTKGINTLNSNIISSIFNSEKENNLAEIKRQLTKKEKQKVSSSYIAYDSVLAIQKKTASNTIKISSHKDSANVELLVEIESKTDSNFKINNNIISSSNTKKTLEYYYQINALLFTSNFGFDKEIPDAFYQRRLLCSGIGFDLGVKFDNHITLSTGINYLNYDHEAHFKETTHFTRYENFVVLNLIRGNDTTKISKDTNVNYVSEKQVRHNNRIQMVQLPIGVGYQFSKGKMDFTINQSISLNYYFLRKGKYLINGNQLEVVEKNQFVNKFHLSYGLNFDFNYKLNTSISLSLSPYGQIHLGKSKISTKYSDYGIQIGLKKIISNL